MSGSRFFERHGIVRSAIKADLLGFALPAFVVFVAGLLVSARDGYDGLVENLWRVIWHPDEIAQLSAAKLAGLALLVVGLAIVFTGVFTLRSNYTSLLVTRVDQRLVTHGIYRHVRHPIYLGALVVLVVAVPVYSTSVRGFLVLSLLIPLVLNRIRLEERLLIEHFGDAYRAYQASTRKLL